MADGLDERIQAIRRRDPRYGRRAYDFVLDALDFTLERMKEAGRRERHISGKELLRGIRDLARERFGPMAKEVFHQWGVRCTEDFGEIVFNLVGEGLLQRRAQDSRKDFADGFDFEREFERGYRLKVPWEETA